MFYPIHSIPRPISSYYIQLPTDLIVDKELVDKFHRTHIKGIRNFTFNYLFLEPGMYLEIHPCSYRNQLHVGLLTHICTDTKNKIFIIYKIPLLQETFCLLNDAGERQHISNEMLNHFYVTAVENVISTPYVYEDSLSFSTVIYQ